MANKFKTLSEAEAAYIALESNLSKTLDSLSASENDNITVKASLAAALAKPDLSARVSELEQAHAETSTKLTAAEAAQKQAQDALAAAGEVTTQAINRKANDILAAAGHKPLNLGSVNLDDKTKTMARAEFEKLPVAQKSAAMRGGVRLTD